MFPTSSSAARLPTGPSRIGEEEGNAVSDATLMTRVEQRDEDALSVLYDRYAPMVYGRAVGMLHVPEDAEEVTLDVFLQLWRTPSKWDPKRGSLCGWLVVMARSRAADRRRSRGRRAIRLREAALRGGGEFCVEPGRPADSPRRGRCRATLSPLLAALSTDQRAAITLVFCQGLSQREAAQTLGEPLGTVKSRIRRGLRALGDQAHNRTQGLTLLGND